jgi:hypothetical protein
MRDYCSGVLMRSILERIEEIYGTASATTSMCESFVVIDKRIEQYRQLLRSTADFLEKGRINRLIMELYAERVVARSYLPEVALVARSYLPEEASRDPAAIKAALRASWPTWCSN